MGVRVRVTVILAVSALGAACGSSSSTSPKPNACASNPTDTASGLTTAALAVHLDSLQQTAAGCGQSDRYRLLAYPIAALAENVTPLSISLTVNGAAQSYSAAGLEIVGVTAGTNPTPSDSFFVFVAWSDNNATDVFLYEAQPPDTVDNVENLAFASDNQNSSSSNLAVSLLSNGASCGAVVALPFAAGDDFVSGTTCTQAVTSFNFTASFTATSSNPNTSYSYNAASLPTARIVLPATGGQLRVPKGLIAGLETQLHTK
jgi:hypothetical protein